MAAVKSRLAFAKCKEISRYFLIFVFLCMVALYLLLLLDGSTRFCTSDAFQYPFKIRFSCPISRTPAFKLHYRKPITNTSIDQDLAKLRDLIQIANSTTEDPPPKVRVSKCITNDPTRARKNWYTLMEDLIDPFCPTSLTRIPKGHAATPPCLSVIRNAFIGAHGVLFQPSTRTIFDLGGGCCADGDKTTYRRKRIEFNDSQLLTVRPGRVVLNLGQHHGSTYHHVMYELLPRYLSVAPLVEKSGMDIIVDDSSISPKLLTDILGVRQEQILMRPFKKENWLYASVILIPPPILQPVGAKYYPNTIMHATSSVLRDTLWRNARSKSNWRKRLVLLERAKSRSSAGDCSEARCIQNFKALHRGILKQFGGKYKVIKFGAKESLTRAVKVFSTADVVVGFHGAGFQNMMFCRVGVTVVHIGWRTHYKEQAERLGLRYHLSLTKNTRRNTKNIKLNIDKVLTDIETSILEDTEREEELD